MNVPKKKKKNEARIKSKRMQRNPHNYSTKEQFSSSILITIAVFLPVNNTVLYSSRFWSFFAFKAAIFDEFHHKHHQLHSREKSQPQE